MGDALPNSFVQPGGYFQFCPETDTVETWMAHKQPDVSTSFELTHTTTSSIFLQWRAAHEKCAAEILAHRARAHIANLPRTRVAKG